MKKIIFFFILLINVMSIYAANERLELNEKNCRKINAHGIHEAEAISREYKVSMSSVQLIKAEWGLSQYGNMQCNLLFDTAKGLKKCPVLLILTDDKGKTAFGISVLKSGDYPGCF